ncbi:unnamed protein product [Caenorhabditis brenneri]
MDELDEIFHTSITSLFFKENGFANISFQSGNRDQNRKILSLFPPASITLFAQAPVDFRVQRDILIQNFNAVHVLDVQVALDDLLMANIRFIDIDSRVSTITVNQFLKL